MHVVTNKKVLQTGMSSDVFEGIVWCRGQCQPIVSRFFEAELQVHSTDTEKKRSGLVKTVEETPPNDTASNLTDLMPSTICQHLSSASYMEDQVFFCQPHIISNFNSTL